MEETLHKEISPGLFFNINRNSGRWFISKKKIFGNSKKTLDDLKEWDASIKTIIINLTDKCNLDCVYCSRQCARSSHKSMSLELLTTILRKIADYGIKEKIIVTVQFHGGEPLIEFAKIKNAIDSLSEKERMAIKFRVQTNGILIDENTALECIKRKIEMGISLDGREIENDLMRKDSSNNGSSKRILKALKIIKKYQKEVNCLTVVTNINVANLDKILEYFSDLGINNVGFLPLYEEPTNRTIEKKMVPDMRVLAKSQKILFDKWIETLKTNRDINITTFQILIWNLLASNSHTPKFRVNCGVGVNSLFVEDDGSVWGCGAFSYCKKLQIGDFNFQNLYDMQKGEAYNVFKKRVTANTEKCRDCVYQFICRGGCVANGYKNKKNIFETDIWCNYWEEMIEYMLLKIYQNPKILKLIPDYNIKKN